MKARKASFRIILRPEPEGGYTVIVPSLPGCITYGEDIKEAREMAEDAIKAYLDSMKKHGEAFLDDTNTFEGMLTLQYA
ncbi:MAG: type II toxin-antitoxin system HicB family antitoxin [Smithellaceae bacterium]|nr:type II toxin-antitoxin system HicB family antitoxin [Smithellaceae bacterium]